VSACDDAHEAYTAIARSVLSSHEMKLVAGAEAVGKVERNMSGAFMRGAVALPGSKNTLRAKGTRRNPGDLISPAIAQTVPGHGRKPRRRSCRGRAEESDGCIVPMKRRTMLSGQRQRRWRREGQPVEGKVRGDACPGHCARSGMLARTPIAFDLRQEPGAGKPLAGICAGAGRNPRPYRDPT
jgi:hypothetical protein